MEHCGGVKRARTEEDGGEPAGDLVSNLLQHWK
jgi:hypothetical protein